MTLDGDRSDGSEAWARAHPLALLVLVLVFIYLSLTGDLNDIFPPEPASAPLPLASPRLVPLSGAAATEAAQLLRSSLARLYAEPVEFET
jgi:hypothetical protein